MARGTMKLINDRTGEMQCTVCGSIHFANLRSKYDRADRVTRYYRGSWQCVNRDNHPAMEEELAESTIVEGDDQ
jgi:hypothetical protein